MLGDQTHCLNFYDPPTRLSVVKTDFANLYKSDVKMDFPKLYKSDYTLDGGLSELQQSSNTIGGGHNTLSKLLASYTLGEWSKQIFRTSGWG